MKNKGRKHKAGSGDMAGIANCKGCLVHVTRPVEKMSKGPFYNRGGKKKITKKGWIKRIRGYFKQQFAKDSFEKF